MKYLQKNTEKLRNLLLIGYSPARVSLPYQLLTIALNALVLVLAIVLMLWIRHLYLERLWQIFPAMSEGPLAPALLVGVGIFVIVTFFNMLAIRHKINVLAKAQQ